MSSENTTDRLEILDLMRFFAAVSVMFYHFTFYPTYLSSQPAAVFPAVQSGSKFGYLGVELFFLISGFVIFWSATGRTLASYAASRISRLVPSLWAAVALTSTVRVLSGTDVRIVVPKVIAANMALIAGPLNIPYIDGAYWTLQYEVRFYILAWILVWASKRVRLEIWLAVWLAGLALVHTDLAPKMIKGLTLFPYGSYFVAGSLFFLIWRHGATRIRIALLLAAFTLSLLCVRGEAPSFMNGDASTRALLTASVIVAAQFLIFAVVAARALELPHSAWWLWLGSLTYPLYLIHSVFGQTLASRTAPEIGATMAVVVSIAASLTLAAVFSRSTETYGCAWLRRALSNAFSALGRWVTPAPRPEKPAGPA